MPKAIPAYYSSLPPFRELFDEGLPVLMYHKLGPRPRLARLKGLYVSSELFDAQMAEIREAGFQTTAIGSPAETNGKNFVVTFDDGFKSVLDLGLPILKRHGFRAIQYLVSERIGKKNEWDLRAGEVAEPLMTEDEVRAWLAAGHWIGSHSMTHARLTRLSLRDAREEIVSSKKRLEDIFGLPIVDFCFPFGDCSPALNDLVTEAGYKTACTTEVGINPPGYNAMAIQRIMARYRSRSLRSFTEKISRLSKSPRI